MPTAEYYQKHKDRLKEEARKWYRDNPDKVRAYYEARKDSHREYMFLYKKDEKVRIKNRARSTVANRIRRGTMERGSCEKANCFLRAEAHHDDYSKQVDVRWLCKQHHEDLHHGRDVDHYRNILDKR